MNVFNRKIASVLVAFFGTLNQLTYQRIQKIADQIYCTTDLSRLNISAEHKENPVQRIMLGVALLLKDHTENVEDLITISQTKLNISTEELCASAVITGKNALFDRLREEIDWHSFLLKPYYLVAFAQAGARGDIEFIEKLKSFYHVEDEILPTLKFKLEAAVLGALEFGQINFLKHILQTITVEDKPALFLKFKDFYKSVIAYGQLKGLKFLIENYLKEIIDSDADLLSLAHRDKEINDYLCSLSKEIRQALKITDLKPIAETSLTIKYDFATLNINNPDLPTAQNILYKAASMVVEFPASERIDLLNSISNWEEFKNESTIFNLLEILDLMISREINKELVFITPYDDLINFLKLRFIYDIYIPKLIAVSDLIFKRLKDNSLIDQFLQQKLPVDFHSAIKTHKKPYHLLLAMVCVNQDNMLNKATFNGILTHQDPLFFECIPFLKQAQLFNVSNFEIIKNHKKPYFFVQALLLLKKSGIMNEMIFEVVSNQENPVLFSQALLALHGAQLLAPEVNEALSCHNKPQQLINAIMTLKQGNILTFEFVTALINHDTAPDTLAFLLLLLHRKNFFSSERFATLIQHINIISLEKTLLYLSGANVLNLKNLDFVMGLDFEELEDLESALSSLCIAKIINKENVEFVLDYAPIYLIKEQIYDLKKDNKLNQESFNELMSQSCPSLSM